MKQRSFCFCIVKVGEAVCCCTRCWSGRRTLYALETRGSRYLSAQGWRGGGIDADCAVENGKCPWLVNCRLCAVSDLCKQLLHVAAHCTTVGKISALFSRIHFVYSRGRRGVICFTWASRASVLLLVLILMRIRLLCEYVLVHCVMQRCWIIIPRFDGNTIIKVLVMARMQRT